MNNYSESSSSNQDKYRILFVLGPPGSGKNTQCDNIKEKYNLLHLSCGELLRECVSSSESDPELREEINLLMREGKIVPVEITCGLMKIAMEKAGGTKNFYLIDGFPRNKENLDGFLNFFGDSAEVMSVLFLEATQENCTNRITLRSQISGRIDDNQDSLRKRFDVFYNETMGNYTNLEKITKVIGINADDDKDTVFGRIIVQLDKLFGTK